MTSFWETPASITERLGEDYLSFPLFGALHIGEIIACFIICGMVGYIFYKQDEKGRKRIYVIITILLLLDELWKQIGSLVTGQWVAGYLPLHLCSINIFLCLYNTLKPSDNKKEILYSCCMPGAFTALLLPSWQAAPLWNFMHLHSYTVHLLLFLYPLLLLIEGHRPNIKRLPFCLLVLFLEAIPIFIVNKLLDTNFFFINDHNANILTRFLSSILGEKLYIIGIPFMLVIVWIFLYLPWLGKRKQTAS